MNIEKKLKDLPHIYYFNLDQDKDRLLSMETQFDQLKIKNHTRISGNNFLCDEIKDWEHLLIGNYTWNTRHLVANFVSHIKFFNQWLKNTNDEYLIIMEDDYDFTLMDYWHFSWNDLMNNLPANWDCIQLGYEHSQHIIFCLHFKPPIEQLFGPCLLNRSFVKKIVRLYYDNGKFLINRKQAFEKNHPNIIPYSVDTAIINDGVTYRLPLITTKPEFIRPERASMHDFFPDCASTYHYWWKIKKNTISLDKFWEFSLSNVDEMAQPVTDYSEYL